MLLAHYSEGTEHQVKSQLQNTWNCRIVQLNKVLIFSSSLAMYRVLKIEISLSARYNVLLENKGWFFPLGLAFRVIRIASPCLRVWNADTRAGLKDMSDVVKTRPEKYVIIIIIIIRHQVGLIRPCGLV